MRVLKIRPAEDRRRPGQRLLVRDPVTRQHLDPEGEEKTITPFYARALRCGDVEVCK